jgi:hypothetical protein
MTARIVWAWAGACTEKVINAVAAAPIAHFMARMSDPPFVPTSPFTSNAISMPFRDPRERC